VKAVRVRVALPQWLPYEVRWIGSSGLVTPALILAAVAGVGLLMDLNGAGRERVSQLLATAPEWGLPLAAGVIASSVVAREPTVDLHLTLETRYRTTVVRRLAVLVGWTALASFAWCAVLWAAGLWQSWVPGSFLLGQLSWLAPLLWFVSLGSLLALVLRSRAAGGAILGGLWTAEHLFGGLMILNDGLSRFFLFATTYTQALKMGPDWWLENRLVLLVSALAMALCVVALLGRTEALAAGGDE
jgi:hypothetical protein